MNAPDHSAHRLSKSTFMAGLQCPKGLWWRVHEPGAPELVARPAAQAIFDRGHVVGELARTHVPGGVLIDFPHWAVREKVAATAEALAAGVRVIYEASFVADDVFAAVDILEKTAHGYALVEVKSTLDVKDQHLDDIAVQLHVARAAGLPVERAEIMHLNRACRHPDLSNLFVREDVTPRLEEALRDIPERARSMRTVLAGPLPDVSIGPHCFAPYECPFMPRCWPPLVDNDVRTLYGLRAAKKVELIHAGVRSVLDLPDDYPAHGARMRQIHSIRRGEMIVEPGLREALERVTPPLAFLDFETIAPAVPAWPGCHPCQTVPVQFSAHRYGAGGLEHVAWLADGRGDPREAFARALIGACAGARTVCVYNAAFERPRIHELADALPHLSTELMDLSDRLCDLLPIVRDHIYHPAFGGGFSLKAVFPALVPGAGYDALAIQDGTTASNLLEHLLLNGHEFGDAERMILRENLLGYCQQDTLATVRLYERLVEIAREHGSSV